MNHYELVTVIPGHVTEDEVAGVKTEIQSTLEKVKATVRGESSLGRLKLAYSIRAAGKIVTHGTYLVYNIDVEPSGVSVLNEALRINPNVARHLISEEKVLTPEQKEARAALQAKIRAKRTTEEIQKSAAQQRTAGPQEKVSQEQLTKKLDTLMEEDIKV